MSKTSAKKPSQSSKQAQQKLTRMVRTLSKTKVVSNGKLLATCAKKIYCF